MSSEIELSEFITSYNELSLGDQDLIDAASATRAYAYAPYSKFKVGAAIRTKCGKVFTGCNVENAALAAGSCAERTAICKAISEGYLKFEACAVVACEKDSFTIPCKVCRQMFAEFATEDFPIFVVKAENPVKLVLCTSVYNLKAKQYTYASKHS